ncbi:nucleotide pyrophosphohydrolase [Corynebacterium pacaense]|uniref:nucleotide pyrophosphohydrolase n=1 Tax=Corynebacterium pacaense TaxID=1816684 RepID=UPI0009BBC9AB|nr:nucleotide pyrophosphohydrolase [Corynebacterium pacaense]
MDTEQVFAGLRKFAQVRDWEQFHSRENLAKSIGIEAAELLECFQWNARGDEEQVRLELADVLTYCYFLAMKLDVDPGTIVLEKLALTEKKYPVNKAFGKSEKYDRL